MQAVPILGIETKPESSAPARIRCLAMMAAAKRSCCSESGISMVAPMADMQHLGFQTGVQEWQKSNPNVKIMRCYLRHRSPLHVHAGSSRTAILGINTGLLFYSIVGF